MQNSKDKSSDGGRSAPGPTLESRLARLERTVFGPADGEIAVARDRAQRVLGRVAEVFRVTMRDLKGPRRQRRYVEPRWIAMRILRRHLRGSLEQVGEWMGNKGHGTVCNGIKTLEGRMQIDPGFRAIVEKLDMEFPAFAELALAEQVEEFNQGKGAI